MKVLILAGGLGSRLSEETTLKPKPMVEIGGKPILWHILKIYSFYGYNDFIILLGYKGYMVKEYFANYMLHQSDVTIDVKNRSMKVHNNNAEPWKITLIDTGLNTMTGGRIKRAKEYLDNKPFFLTYGDGVSDIDIIKTLKFHNSHDGSITMSAVQAEGRFGALTIDNHNRVEQFSEKPKGDGSWINGGFFICNPDIFEYIENDQSIFEKGPLVQLTEAGKLYTYKHSGFWKPMDTLRDKQVLEDLIDKKAAPWMKWK